MGKEVNCSQRNWILMLAVKLESGASEVGCSVVTKTKGYWFCREVTVVFFFC